MFVQAVQQQNKGGHYYNEIVFKLVDQQFLCRPTPATTLFSCYSVCFHPVTWILLVFGKQQNWNLEQLKKHLWSEVTVSFMSINLNYYSFFYETRNMWVWFFYYVRLGAAARWNSWSITKAQSYWYPISSRVLSSIKSCKIVTVLSRVHFLLSHPTKKQQILTVMLQSTSRFFNGDFV